MLKRAGVAVRLRVGLNPLPDYDCARGDSQDVPFLLRDSEMHLGKRVVCCKGTRIQYSSNRRLVTLSTPPALLYLIHIGLSSPALSMTVAARSSAVEMKTKRDADDCISHLKTMEIATKDPRSDNTINYAMRTKRLLRRVDVRLLPICAWMYLLNYLDRGNIGNARVLNQETGNSLIQETGITPSQYAWVVTLFSIAYCLFEVPSNWIMKKYVHPSHWLGILLVAWGACTMAFAAVHNFTTTAIVRVLIGVFEAGFFPGIVFLITFWYRPEERSIRIALIVSSATLAGAFGGCIAYGVGHMNGIGGIAGFRWLSILEGALTIVSVIPMLLVLPNHPTTVKWLSNDEKGFAITRVAETMNPEVSSAKSKRAVLQETLEPRMICHYLAYVCLISKIAEFCANKTVAYQFHPVGILDLLLTDHCRWPGVYVGRGPDHDSTALGSGICHLATCSLVCRLS